MVIEIDEKELEKKLAELNDKIMDLSDIAKIDLKKWGETAGVFMLFLAKRFELLQKYLDVDDDSIEKYYAYEEYLATLPKEHPIFKFGREEKIEEKEEKKEKSEPK